MKKKQIINILNNLDIDKDKYIITGSTALLFYKIIKECDYIFLIGEEKIDNELINVVNSSCDYETIHGFNIESLNSLYEKETNKTIKRKINDLILMKDNHHFEHALHEKGYNLIAGCDEAGRGPLCGPVVCASVVLPNDYNLPGLTDSKKLSEKQREKYFDIIKKDAISYSISIIDNKKIDEINILESSRLGMNEAVDSLDVKPDFIITDAMDLKRENALAIIKGDAKSITIAAASVLAKVTRDHIMDEIDKLHPEYELKKHKGYPTKRHLELLQKYGILDIYRTTYNPVKEILERNNNEIK